MGLIRSTIVLAIISAIMCGFAFFRAVNEIDLTQIPSGFVAGATSRFISSFPAQGTCDLTQLESTYATPELRARAEILPHLASYKLLDARQLYSYTHTCAKG